MLNRTIENILGAAITLMLVATPVVAFGVFMYGLAMIVSPPVVCQ